MIVPPRDENGIPDIASLNEWSIGCDACGATQPMHDCADWMIGRSTDFPVYCPACETGIARTLIRQATGRRRRVGAGLSAFAARLLGWVRRAAR